MWSIARSSAAELEAELPLPIEIRPLRSARRMRLRFDEAAGTLKLTCPARTSKRTALAWALDQRDWIDQQLARAEPAEPFLPGALIPLFGRETRICWSERAPRAPALIDGELICGGPQSSLGGRIGRYLKQLALEAMSADVAYYAERAGVTPRAVSIGDAASRWGSCTSDRRIRLNWRLILAPPEVRRYVVAHEVAHLVHLNHSSEFKALEAELFGPGLAQSKALLRRIGPRLRRVGRGI
jgi:predicted metal-dependent hydrolase